jgi:type II secretion system-associated lipoprotein
MKNFKTGVFLILIFFVAGSCASFLEKKQIKALKLYESKNYILKQDTKFREPSLKKGQEVKVYIITGKDFVKVYCYPASTSFLKSDRTLLLYLFEDDFEKKKFNSQAFEDKLYSLAEPKAE